MSDDKGGYGKPPKKHQFKKGQSGNPKGRPKRQKLKDSFLLMDEIFDEPAIINVEGKQIKNTKRKAFLRVLLKLATEGKPVAINAMLSYLLADRTREEFLPQEFDEQLLEEFVARQLESDHDKE